jgi:Spy/CpxP family protein refolding chaperone
VSEFHFWRPFTRPFSIALLLLCLVLPSSVKPVLGQDQVVDFDFTSLAHPEIAENLQLTDPQRTQVATLIAEQVAKATAAAEADRPAIASEYAAKLRALLTPEQLAKLAELGGRTPLVRQAGRPFAGDELGP